jgi:hypothetical protein
MSDRWLPVVAAILGVLGGVAGAAVGGYVANKGQEQRLEAERDSSGLTPTFGSYARSRTRRATQAGMRTRSLKPPLPRSCSLLATLHYRGRQTG